jgi:hypothetical protein
VLQLEKEWESNPAQHKRAWLSWRKEGEDMTVKLVCQDNDSTVVTVKIEAAKVGRGRGFGSNAAGTQSSFLAMQGNISSSICTSSQQHTQCSPPAEQQFVGVPIRLALAIDPAGGVQAYLQDILLRSLTGEQLSPCASWLLSSGNTERLRVHSLVYCSKALTAGELRAAQSSGASTQVHGQAPVSLAADMACQQLLLDKATEEDSHAVSRAGSTPALDRLLRHRLLGELMQGDGSTTFVGLLIALIVSVLLNVLLAYKVQKERGWWE